MVSFFRSLIHKVAAVRITCRGLLCFDLISMPGSYSDYFIGVGLGPLKLVSFLGDSDTQ